MTLKNRTLWVLLFGFLSLLLSGCAGTTFTAVTAGDYHACAITRDGQVECWGDNQHRQLGDGSTDTISILPVTVSNLSGVKAIAASGSHTCALTRNGAVLCWGENTSGQLGDGTTLDRGTPVAVNGLPGGIAKISAGETNSCAITSAGESSCWGKTVNSTSSGDFQTIAQNQNHACALTGSGAVKCWGNNSDGQLGNGTTFASSQPMEVSGLTSGATQIVVGNTFSCALADGGVKCWGDNYFSELGDGTSTDHYTPVVVPGLSSGVIQIAAGYNFACALTTAGNVKCWGTIDLWNNSHPAAIG